MESNLELLVPLALFGFTLYLSFAFSPGNILYFVSGRLWLWLRRQERREASFRRNAKELRRDLDLFRSAVVPDPDDPVGINTRNLLEKKGVETGYFCEILSPVANKGYVKALHVWTEAEFSSLADGYKKNAKFVILDPGAKKAQIERFSARQAIAEKISRKEVRSTLFRQYLLAPLVDCPVCMLFWYSIPAFAIMSLAAGYAWENYPTHLFAAFALMMIWKSWKE